MDVESVFENLPNFRQAGGRSLCNQEGRRIKDGLIFRSSRTDFLTQEEKLKFLRLGIRSIIDLRRKSEYERAEGSKVLDDLYPPHLLERGEAKEMKPSLRWGGGLRKRKKEKKGGSHPPPQEQQQGKGDTTEATDDGSGPCIKGKRYLVNLMTMDLIWYVFGQINFFVRYLSLLLVLVDWIFGCHLFVKFFSWALVNKQTLAMQYFDMLEYTKPAVADILRLIIDKSNVPVLIHCAHGKDRTGLIVAVVLGCLEVDDETIVEDYSQSEVTSFLVAGLAVIKDRVYREIVEQYGFKEEFTRADAETMREVLKMVRNKYGSISEYLLTAKFTLEEQKRLKDIFLEPADEGQRTE